METTHRVHVADARAMDEVDDGAVDLVVTSPPYPMIEMWDDLFAGLDAAVEDALAAGDGDAAFERMHALLAPVWEEVARVLAPGGIVAVNVGDAARKVDDEFRLYPNHVEVTRRLAEEGLSPLPDVVWRKRANSSNDFMGSGMVPPNAYVTLEHEYVLLFRKGSLRSFPPGDEDRYESAYFWEERNEWFSDLWTDVQGVDQALDAEARERSGAFPFELPYRLISMYSTYGDTVLDPFWGTGTTSLAAMVAARNSVGYEIEEEFTSVFDDRVGDVDRISRAVASDRVDRHEEFVRGRRQDGDDLEYTAENYGFPVVTKQEEGIRFYTADEVSRSDGAYTVTHTPFEDTGTFQASETADGNN